MKTQAIVICALAALMPGIGRAQPPGADEPACRAERARFAVGQPYSERLAERARQAAGARVVRRIVPGRVYTMELQLNRLTLELGPQGVVQAVRCG